MARLSILVPVCDEERTIMQVIDRVFEARVHERVTEKELIVVDDGSKDDTKRLLSTIDDDKIIVLSHEQRLGKGAAIRTALQKATGDIILIQDADLEYDPRDISAIIQPIVEKRAQVVYGSRFLGPHMAISWRQVAANKILTLLTNILNDAILSDMETGYKAFRADLIKSIRLCSNGFEFEPEITTKVLRRGIRIFEVPISYYGPRDYSEGKKIKPKDGLIAAWTLLKYRFASESALV